MDSNESDVEPSKVPHSIQMASATSPPEKVNTFDQSHHVEKLTQESLTPAHREYLIGRHGTVDLEPLPSMDPIDPLNWPTWRV